MSAEVQTAPDAAEAGSVDGGPPGLVRAGTVAGIIAAASTTLLAVVASAAGASLEVDGEAIPAPAFAMWTIVGAALGVLLARLLGERRRFITVTVALTALSLAPAIAAPDDVATRLVLVAAHLVAAGIIISALSRRLPRRPAG